MKASERKKQLREARREKIRQAREVWGEEEFGLRVVQRARGVRVEWAVDSDPFVALMSLDRMRSALLPSIESELVTGCRSAGIAWEEIGWALGVSGEAVRQRLGHLDQSLEE